jgi:hypothetical protein
MRSLYNQVGLLTCGTTGLTKQSQCVSRMVEDFLSQVLPEQVLRSGQIITQRVVISMIL